MLKRWQTRIVLFLAVLGPGFITANVDNDAGGILTYSGAGAQFGYSLLWTILPITVALIVVQEMCARMGVVTGKGLSDLIREEFGLRATFVTMVLLLIVNFGLVMTEFIGIAGSLELFHISKYVSVPVCALLVWLLAVRGDYKSVEKVFLAASVFYIAYIITGVLSGPSWREAMLATVKVPTTNVWHTPGYISMTIAVIGTTIAPWMQFYLQSSVVEKGVAVKDYAASTNGLLTLHYLPGYAPELNPDELVWSHVKRTGVARTPLRRGETLHEKIEAQLNAMKRMPQLIRSFFKAPTVSYITDW